MKKYGIRFRVNLLIVLFLIINIAGIIYVLKNLSLSVIYQQISSLVLAVFLWVVVILLIRWMLLKYLFNPVKKIESILKLVSTGDLSNKINYRSNDELGQIAESIDLLIQNQSNLADFLEKIGDGNFDIVNNVLGDKDKLGHSIMIMRDKLQKLVNEDTSRRWSTEGIAKFGAILRENNDDLKVVCDKLLSHLVKYLNANQGTIFLLNDDNKEKVFLEMISTYAWGRKKYISKTVEIGEGLIGQAAIEKDTIYLTDVPDNFIRITSGLGDSNPTSVLIVPLLFDDELSGIMEFAAFKPFEKFEIDFVEKLAEIIASTISRVKTNKQTQKLLEDSQKLTEELRTQEEEMRQNLEVMNATQEEMQQREVERIGIFTAINNTIATVEFSMEGRILNANDMYLNMMNCTLEEIENKTDRVFADKSNEPIELYNKFWDDLNHGILKTCEVKRITKTGREIWLNASYTPALDKHGKPYKVIKLAQDITEKKKSELESLRQAEELRAQGEKLKIYTSELEDIKQNLSEKLNEASKGLIKKIQDIEYEKAKNTAVLEGCVDGVISFNQEGIIEYFNHAAEEIWGVERENVLGKTIDNVIPIVVTKTDNDVTAYYSNNGSTNEILIRTEISCVGANSTPVELLATLTKAKVSNDFTFTIFAQKISVDFF